MSTPPRRDDCAPWPDAAWKYWCVNALLVAHLLALGLMVAGGGVGAFSSPPLVARAASITAPYVRFTGMQNSYRFFAPDPGPATVLWARLAYDDGSIRWMEFPGRESRRGTLLYQRELYPAMILGMQTAPPGTPVVAGYPHLTDLGFTYAPSYVRHIAATCTRTKADGTVRRVRSVDLLVVTHAIRSPLQVRQGWAPDDLRLYQATDLGEFTPDGTLPGSPLTVGHQKPPILEVAERMFREATGPHADVAGPDLPQPLRTLLTRFPELRNASDPRPLQTRIGMAVTSRDKAVDEREGATPP